MRTVAAHNKDWNVTRQRDIDGVKIATVGIQGENTCRFNFLAGA